MFSKDEAFELMLDYIYASRHGQEEKRTKIKSYIVEMLEQAISSKEKDVDIPAVLDGFLDVFNNRIHTLLNGFFDEGENLARLGFDIIGITETIYTFFEELDEEVPLSKNTQRKIARFMVEAHNDLINNGLLEAIADDSSVEKEQVYDSIYGIPAALSSGLHMTEKDVDEAVKIWCVDGLEAESLCSDRPIERAGLVLSSGRRFSKESLEMIFNLEAYDIPIDEARGEAETAIEAMIFGNPDMHTVIDVLEIILNRPDAKEIFSYVNMGGLKDCMNSKTATLVNKIMNKLVSHDVSR